MSDNIEAERAVLGSLLRDPSKISEVAAVLRPDHFYLDKHGLVYRAIVSLDGSGVDVDFLTVSDELERSGKLAVVDGPPYLLELIEAVPTAAHVDHYVATMLRLASDRAAIRIAGQVAQLAFQGKGEALQYLAREVDKEQADYLGGDDGPVLGDVFGQMGEAGGSQGGLTTFEIDAGLRQHIGRILRSDV
jgi:replicative DNA helicase